jgi:molybdenum cofactor biosynthesis enzyme MoaA
MLRSVTPAEDVFSITWNIGPRCNFSCRYCPPKLHDKVSPHASLDLLKQRWLDILDKTSHRNKKYKIGFTGGEVTINPDFLDFLFWLRSCYSDQISSLGFTTNGSASKAYYHRAIEAVDWISFSSHFEFANEKKLKTNILATHIKAFKLKKQIFVNVMDEKEYPTQVQDLIEFCEKNRISYSNNIINWNRNA